MLFRSKEFPGQPSKVLTSPTCGMHWPNMLHPNPERNAEVVEKWINYLRNYNEKPDWMLAPDSVYFQHQLAHHMLTKAKITGNFLDIDFTETDKLSVDIGKAELTVKIVTQKPVTLKELNIKILSQTFQNYSEPQLLIQLLREPGQSKARIVVS